MNEKKLSNSLNEYRFDVVSSIINIYTDNINNPIVKYNGSFDIVDNGSIAKIQQTFKKSKNNLFFKKRFGKQSIYVNGCKIIKNGNIVTVLGNGGNICQINGRTFFNGVEITDDMFESDDKDSLTNQVVEEPSIDLILPPNSENISLELYSTNGEINLRNLILQRLIINNKNGNINLKDIDSILSKIELINGDINVEIAESYMNYILSINTINGACTQKSIEDFDKIKKILSEKHRLDIKNINGDIDVTFKGKFR